MGQLEKKPGRPRIQTNDEKILYLRDEENLGWRKGAEVYRDRTHQWISPDTFKRRYVEAKYKEELLQRVLDALGWTKKH